MKTLQEIMRSNYEAVKNRGLIDEETTLPDFITKLQEEVGEFIKAKNEQEAAAELADIVGVCLNIASHYEIDIVAALDEMVRRNEMRAQKAEIYLIPIKRIIAKKENEWTILAEKTADEFFDGYFSAMLYSTPMSLLFPDGHILRGYIISYVKRTPEGLIFSLVEP